LILDFYYNYSTNINTQTPPIYPASLKPKQMKMKSYTNPQQLGLVIFWYPGESHLQVGHNLENGWDLLDKLYSREYTFDTDHVTCTPHKNT